MVYHATINSSNNKIMILYKFRDWNNDNHKRVLLFRELFFSSPKQFNDPFDCKIFPDYRVLRENEEERLRFLNSKCIEHHPDYSYAQRIGLVTQQSSDPDMFSDEKIAIHLRRFSNLLNAYFGVLSVGINNAKDLQMWSSYAASGTGFSIGFKQKELCSQLKMQFDESIDFGPVDYVSKMPRILPSADYKESSLTIIKSKNKLTWNHEAEFRFVLSAGANQPYTYQTSVVEHVIIGPSMKADDQSVIIDICRQILPDVPILKVIPKLYEYEIDFVRLA